MVDDVYLALPLDKVITQFGRSADASWPASRESEGLEVLAGLHHSRFANGGFGGEQSHIMTHRAQGCRKCRDRHAGAAMLAF